jgi:hypothetical protein
MLQEVAVPAQDGVRADQQLELPELAHRQAMEQSGEQEPVGRREHRFGRLALQDRQLVPQHQDLHLLLTIAHRQQPYKGERVRHREIGQAQQHSRSSCRGGGIPASRQIKARDR